MCESATAICTWEQRSYSGAQANKFPFVGGHEIAGEIAAIGPGTVTDLQIGERVAIGSASCGKCHWCKTGQDRACKQHYGVASKYGDAWGPGGFAQYKIQTVDGVYRTGDAPFETACALRAAFLRTACEPAS